MSGLIHYANTIKWYKWWHTLIRRARRWVRLMVVLLRIKKKNLVVEFLVLELGMEVQRRRWERADWEVSAFDRSCLFRWPPQPGFHQDAFSLWMLNNAGQDSQAMMLITLYICVSTVSSHEIAALESSIQTADVCVWCVRSKDDTVKKKICWNCPCVCGLPRFFLNWLRRDYHWVCGQLQA